MTASSKRAHSAMPTVIALALLCIVMLAGCAESSSMTSTDPSPQAPADQPPSASITVCNETPNGCDPATSYSLATIRDLSVQVQWANVPPGTQTQTLQMLDPGGGSYEVKNSSFVVADGVPGQATTHVLIPVSGSMIAQRQITGQWAIQVTLNGQPIASQTVTFEP